MQRRPFLFEVEEATHPDDKTVMEVHNEWQLNRGG